MNKNKEEQKMPWKTHSHIWKTQGAYMAWLRGSLRKAVWDRYPIKLDFKNKNTHSPPPDYKGRAKSGAFCSLSGEWIAKSYCEVDHIIGNASLKEWSDIPKFLDHLLLCADNLALVSKRAHKIKSYAERMGISYEDAELEKEHIIPFKKLSAEKQKAEILRVLSERQADVSETISEKTLTTQNKRVNIYRKLIKEK